MRVLFRCLALRSLPLLNCTPKISFWSVSQKAQPVLPAMKVRHAARRMLLGATPGARPRGSDVSPHTSGPLPQYSSHDFFAPSEGLKVFPCLGPMCCCSCFRAISLPIATVRHKPDLNVVPHYRFSIVIILIITEEDVWHLRGGQWGSFGGCWASLGCFWGREVI